MSGWDSENSWAFGDLALEREPIRTTPETRERSSVWETLADQLGVSVLQLRLYRGTAAAWPPQERRHDVSFSVHAVLRIFADL